MRKVLLTVWFVFFLLSPALVKAQAPKAWLKQISTTPPGPFAPLKPLHVTYGLSWKGSINAGKMEFSLTEPQPGVYLSQAKGQSAGLARAVFPYDFSGTSQTRVADLKPLTFDFNDKWKTKTYRYSLLFQPDQLVSQTDLTDLKTGFKTPYHNVYVFENDVARDLMSSILYLRSQPLTKGQKISLITATFNKPYLTEFTVLDRDVKTIKRTKYKAIKLDAKISKIHSNMTTEPYTKIEKATIWVSDDEYRLPLEIQGDIFIGYISAQMTSRKWL